MRSLRHGEGAGHTRGFTLLPEPGVHRARHVRILPAWTPRAYAVNVSPYKHGISYGNGWTHIDGWSERMIDYIAAVEAEAAA